MAREYPNHIYEPIRQQVAVSYLQHEFRKLLWRVPEKNWQAIDKDIADWINSPNLSNPRDFWNGFHGISMGFKLKIGLIYYVTAQNMTWERKSMPISDLWFGVDLQQTRVAGEGKLPAKRVAEYYAKPENESAKKEQLEFTLGLSGNSVLRDDRPIIVTQKEKDGKLFYSVYDGNRRLAKAILENKDSVDAFVGTFFSGMEPKNFWAPTTVLMENLYFARLAYKREDKELFGKYMTILKDIISQSESARYEFQERVLTSQQPFRDEVLKMLNLQELS